MKRFLIVAAAVGMLAGLGAQAFGQQYCYYAPGNCWPMPTNDNCQWGTLVTSCDNPGFTQEYCNYGPCVGEGEDEYSCGDGGCYPLAGGATTCATGGTKVTECPAGTLPPASGGTPSTPGTGNGGGTAANCDAAGVCENCQTDGKYSYCQWETGCNSVNNKYGADNIGKTCDEVVASCRAYGVLWLGATQPSGINAGNEYGAGVRCNSLPELSQAPDITPTDPTAPVENCKVDGKFSYCQWETGCNSVNNKYGDNIGKTCEAVIAECQLNGALYLGATQPSGINAGNDYGTGVQCASQPELTPTVGVKLLADKSVAKGLKVSYAKNRVTVNWTPATKVSSGTVQLINMKGAAISTAFIKANSSKVSVKLGTVGVPAGMYFVHINAVGQNGKKIVTQSAISIVK
jgi:hypothetical protein